MVLKGPTEEAGPGVESYLLKIDIRIQLWPSVEPLLIVRVWAQTQEPMHTLIIHVHFGWDFGLNYIAIDYT